MWAHNYFIRWNINRRYVPQASLLDLDRGGTVADKIHSELRVFNDRFADTCTSFNVVHVGIPAGKYCARRMPE